MSLIIHNALVYEEIGYLSSNRSRFYITIDAKYLSESYDLMSGARISGKILKVTYGDRLVKELENSNIQFYIEKNPVYDRLFISKKDWNEYFREYGLVKAGFKISLELTEAEQGQNTYKLFTKGPVELSYS